MGFGMKKSVVPAKRSLVKENHTEDRIQQCPLIELNLTHTELITEKLPATDDISSQVESITLKILKREANDHDRR